MMRSRHIHPFCRHQPAACGRFTKYICLVLILMLATGCSDKYPTRPLPTSDGTALLSTAVEGPTLDATPAPMPTQTTIPSPAPSPVPTQTEAPSPAPSPTSMDAANKLEFIAYGEIACGGLAPVPGCIYMLQEWVGREGPIAPGQPIKVLFMNPRSGEIPDIESCYGYYVDSVANDWSMTPIRVRVRGEPCDYRPDYLFCVCDPDDFVRLDDGS